MTSGGGWSEQQRAFPRQFARTRRFTLGEPRSFTVGVDGRRVVYLRSRAGDDPVTALWTFDVDDRVERLVADPGDLGLPGAASIVVMEGRRRERLREGAAGIVSFGCDPWARVAAFTIEGHLFRADLVTGEVRHLPTAGPVFDPHPDWSGNVVAYVGTGGLRVIDGAGCDRLLVADEGPEITWGQAEFLAAEELPRKRGFWWAPDGTALVATRVDVSQVERWHLCDPVDPTNVPVSVAFPRAGSANADVSLWRVGLDGGRSQIRWDVTTFPYLADVSWQPHGPLTLLAQTRDQRTTQVLDAGAGSGPTAVIHEEHSPEWTEIVRGLPAGWLTDGRLVVTVEDADTRRLLVGGELSTPAGLEIRRVAAIGANVVFTASEHQSEIHVWRLSASGALTRLTSAPGVHDGWAGGATIVVVSTGLEYDGPQVTVHHRGEQVGVITSMHEPPVVRPRPVFLEAGHRRLNTALLLPSGGSGRPWPVLVYSYGAPQVQFVVKNPKAFAVLQWLADQGFAVLAVDGRGTCGRGTRWAHAVHGDLASAPLQDQVDALHAVAATHPELDLTRVGIIGWSYGGYLAALAVLRRPEVFHAAVAGAPVADWRLYYTHYTERYLGDPAEHPDAYDRSSLLGDAAGLRRPLLLVHGLPDDNVVAAHTLRLSRALVAAGRPHTVLPLSGITHVLYDQTVAESRLLLELAFLQGALCR